MRKGCFFTSIALVTVAIGAGSYIIKKYGENFLTFGKEKIMDKAIEDFNDYLSKKINDKSMKDSVLTIVKDYENKIKDDKFDLAMKKIGDVIDKVKVFASDDVIDSTEISELKKITGYDERRTKD
ncbi:hypothetical protein ABRY23_02320 [Melioribacteraceae bacterium 4301-Me]|uniref:hypothetical protein n=1 Tax=Pyranulibacter aquaticus TaxID=3163344 RepID=UPI0035991AE3